MSYKILVIRSYYGGIETMDELEPSDYTRCVPNPIEYESIDEAKAHIDEMYDSTYYLAHNEIDRPEYLIVDYDHTTFSADWSDYDWEDYDEDTDDEADYAHRCAINAARIAAIA